MHTNTQLTSRLKDAIKKNMWRIRAILIIFSLIAASVFLATVLRPPTVSGQELENRTPLEVLPPSDAELSNAENKNKENLDIAYLSAEKDSQLNEKFDRLLAKATANGSVPVIVGFQFDFKLDGSLNEVLVADQRLDISQKQTAVLSKIAPFDPQSIKQFSTIPYFAATVDAATLTYLKSLPEITSISEDEARAPTLAESVPLVTAPTAWNAGFAGGGWTIAVLDTGIDKNHPFLSGKVISEACYSTTTAGYVSLCPGLVSQSTAANSGLNCASNIDGCDHGTHVAGIAAGRGTNFSGVAPDAKLISIKVFSEKFSDCAPNAAPCVRTFDSDQILGLERVMALRSLLLISSVNMSLGGGQYFGSCDTDNSAETTAISNLRSVGVATIISSGNDHYPNAVNFPACISSAIKVGSTGDGSGGATLNEVSGFSNNASFLDLLAPGSSINSSVPGGGFGDKSGTSMAAPHVAGAWALLKSRVPTASVNSILTALTSTGLQVTDTRSSIPITKPRIRIDAALQSLSSGNCQPTTIFANQTVGGSLSTNDCYYNGTNRRFVDFYAFSGSAGERIAISMNSNDFDTYLYLVDSGNNIVAEDDDGGPSANARIPAISGYFTLPVAGTYQIQATSYGNNLTGNYSLNLTSGGVCNYALSQTNYNFGVSGGTNSVFVTASQDSCEWTAASNNSWITITYGADRTGSGAVGYSVAENTSTAPRTGTITVAGQTYTITQTGSCVTAIAPTSQSVGTSAFNSSVRVTATSGCGWTAVKNVSWISIIGQASGTSSGTISYAVAANTSGANRVGTITVLGRIFTVVQSGTFSTCTSSTPIAMNQTINGSLATSDCNIAGQATKYVDPYSFTATAGQRVSITMSGVSSFFATLFLANPNGQIIANDTSLNPTRIPSVSGFFTLPVAGTYIIYATSSAGGIGNYTLTLNDEATCGNWSISALSQQFASSGGNGSVNVTVNNSCVWTTSGNYGWLTVTSGISRIGGGAVTYTVEPNSATESRSQTILVNGSSFVVTQTGTAAPTARKLFDFDGDGKADVAVFRPSNGTWYLQQSTNGFTGIAFGQNGDRLVAADYDGDGKTDLAVYRSGTWYIQRSALGFTGIQFGTAGDIPAPADYDGDGKTDITVFRPSNGAWYIQGSTNGFYGAVFGQSGDQPVAADYDGDGRADIAVNRSGTWYIQRSQLGFVGWAFGIATDKFVPADYDGDGITDVAVFRPSTGTWYINGSTRGFYGAVFGQSGDIPVAADYDGDGKTDLAVFRPAAGAWYRLPSSTGVFVGLNFGLGTDQPVPAEFVP